MDSVKNRIMRRVRAKRRGWVFTPSDVADLGSRGAVDVALQRLVDAGQVRRLSRGLYDYPKRHRRLGLLSPSARDLAKAIARKNGVKIGPSGAAAANRLGLSTQVPVKTVFSTDGKSGSHDVGGRTIMFKRSRAPLIKDGSGPANTAIQALSHVGKGGVDRIVIQRIAGSLADKDVHQMVNARPQMSGWMSDAVIKIAEAHDG